jgi:hypothetical protein
MSAGSPEQDKHGLTVCPSCGGAGGGPTGRAGSAWDDEDYVCPRCEGAGTIPLAHAAEVVVAGPGVAKAVPVDIDASARKGKATA